MINLVTDEEIENIADEQWRKYETKKSMQGLKARAARNKNKRTKNNGKIYNASDPKDSEEFIARLEGQNKVKKKLNKNHTYIVNEGYLMATLMVDIRKDTARIEKKIDDMNMKKGMTDGASGASPEGFKMGSNKASVGNIPKPSFKQDMVDGAQGVSQKKPELKGGSGASVGPKFLGEHTGQALKDGAQGTKPTQFGKSAKKKTVKKK